MKRGTDDKGNSSRRPSRQERSAPSTTTATDEDPLAIWMPLFGQSGEFPMVLPTLMEDIENKTESTPTAPPVRPGRSRRRRGLLILHLVHAVVRFAALVHRSRPLRCRRCLVKLLLRSSPNNPPRHLSRPSKLRLRWRRRLARSCRGPQQTLSWTTEKEPDEPTISAAQQEQCQESSSSEPAPEPPHTSSSALRAARGAHGARHSARGAYGTEQAGAIAEAVHGGAQKAQPDRSHSADDTGGQTSSFSRP